MAFARGNPGAGILQTMGSQGLSLASRGFNRVYDQSLVNRQYAEQEAERQREEKRRKELEKKARQQMLANLGISIGTSALVGGVDALASPAIDTAVDAGVDAGTEAATDAASNAATDVATEGVADAASQTANAVDFSGPPVDSSTLSSESVASGGFKRTAQMPENVPTVGDYTPTGPTESLVHRPRSDGMSRVLAHDNVSYSPSTGQYTGTANAGSRFMRGLGRGALAGGVYGLASMYPGLAPVAQATFNRMDPLYNAKLGEIQGRTGYSDARTDRVRQLTPYEIESEQAEGFARRSRGENSLASAGAHDARRNAVNAKLPHELDYIDAGTNARNEAGGFSRARANAVNTKLPHEVDAIDSLAYQRNKAGDASVSRSGYYDTQNDAAIEKDRRAGELHPSKLRGSEADARYKEQRAGITKQEKLMQVGNDAQREEILNEWVALAEQDIEGSPTVEEEVTPAKKSLLGKDTPAVMKSHPDYNVVHAKIESILKRWKAQGVPERDLLIIINDWRKKYGYAPRLPTSQMTE